MAQGPGSHPDPMDAVRLFDSSRSHAHLFNIARECPSESEWHRVAIYGILDLDISGPQDITTMAGALQGVLKRCDDARVRVWYHEKLSGLRTAEDRRPASQITAAMIFAAQPDWLPDGTLAALHQLNENLPAPEDLELLIEVATDPSRDEAMREAIMQNLLWMRHHADRVDLFIRAHRAGIPPRRYRGATPGVILRGPERDRFALELAALVREDPEIDPTGGLIRILSAVGTHSLGPPPDSPDPARLPPAVARAVLEALAELYERRETLPEGRIRSDISRLGPEILRALGRP